MSVCRIQKREANYTQLGNELINNRELSYTALGVITYLLSKPHNWQVRTKELERPGLCGQFKIRAAVKELERAGYIRRVRLRDPNQKFQGWIFDVYEEPVSEEKRTGAQDETKCPVSGFPTRGKPSRGKPQPNNKDSTKTESTKKTPLPSAAAEGAFLSPGVDEDNTISKPGEEGIAIDGIPDPGGTGFPRKADGKPDWLKAVNTFDPENADKLAKLFPGSPSPRKDEKLARSYIKARRSGLTRGNLDLLCRYYRKARVEGTEPWKTRDVSKFLSSQHLSQAITNVRTHLTFELSVITGALINCSQLALCNSDIYALKPHVQNLSDWAQWVTGHPEDIVAGIVVGCMAKWPTAAFLTQKKDILRNLSHNPAWWVACQAHNWNPEELFGVTEAEVFEAWKERNREELEMAAEYSRDLGVVYRPPTEVPKPIDLN